MLTFSLIFHMVRECYISRNFAVFVSFLFVPIDVFTQTRNGDYHILGPEVGLVDTLTLLHTMLLKIFTA